MKQAKYLKLLNTASAINNNVALQDQQITQFCTQCKTSCAQSASKINDMQAGLRGIDPNMALTQEQLDKIHKFKDDLEELNKELMKALLKPALQTSKDLQKIDHDLNKIIPELIGPCDFDLGVIRNMLDKAKPILASCQQRNQVCLIDIQRLQTQIEQFEHTIHSMDLPSDIQQTTKHVVKVVADLSALSAHVAMLPHGRERYRNEFLPLRNALANLHIQSETLFKEPVLEQKDVPASDSSAPKAQLKT